MGAGAAPFKKSWIHSRNWDLLFISFSVVLVPLPYLVFLLINDWQFLAPLANYFDTNVEDLSRQIVNALVALAIGGPHMFATFTLTSLDKNFVSRFRTVVWSSVAIPVIVTALAFFRIEALVAIFFFWASLHVLHQIVYIVECYNVKRKSSLTVLSRAVDYAVVLTSLYPIATYRMWKGTFAMGPFNVGEEVGGYITRIFPSVIGFPPLFFYLAAGAFGIAFIAFTVKSVIEIRGGYAHIPKIVFIYVTALASFLISTLPELDTAFQGMNVWHSFQYLALSAYINNLRYEHEGTKKQFRLVDRITESGEARKFYLFNVGLTIADAVLALVIFLVLMATGMRGAAAFEIAYYIAVLSFLWIHYYHDHILFTEPQTVAIGA
jgi:hypothetical protein